MMRLPRWMTFGQRRRSLISPLLPTVIMVGLVSWGLFAADMWAAWIPAGWFYMWALFNWVGYARPGRDQFAFAQDPGIERPMVVMLAVTMTLLAPSRAALGFAASWYLSGAVGMLAVLFWTAFFRGRRERI